MSASFCFSSVSFTVSARSWSRSCFHAQPPVASNTPSATAIVRTPFDPCGTFVKSFIYPPIEESQQIAYRVRRPKKNKKKKGGVEDDVPPPPTERRELSS